MIQNNFNGRIEEHKTDAGLARMPTCVDTAGGYICKCVARLGTVLVPRAHLTYRPPLLLRYRSEFQTTRTPFLHLAGMQHYGVSYLM